MLSAMLVESVEISETVRYATGCFIEGSRPVGVYRRNRDVRVLTKEMKNEYPTV